MNYIPSNYLILFVLMLLEGMSFPIPSEVVMPLAGYFSYQGSMNVYLAIIVGTLGSLMGSLIDYFIAYKLGLPFLIKYGNISVFVARFLPAIRALISFPAGLARMPLLYFISITFAGHLIWNTTLVFIGYYFGSAWEMVISNLIKFDYIVLVVIILSIVIFILLKHNFLKFKP